MEIVLRIPLFSRNLRNAYIKKTEKPGLLLLCLLYHITPYAHRLLALASSCRVSFLFSSKMFFLSAGTAYQILYTLSRMPPDLFY